MSIHKPFKICNNKTNNLAKNYRKITPIVNDHKNYYLSMYIIIEIGTQTIFTNFCNFKRINLKILATKIFRKIIFNTYKKTFSLKRMGLTFKK